MALHGNELAEALGQHGTKGMSRINPEPTSTPPHCSTRR